MRPLIDIKITRKETLIFHFTNTQVPIGYEVVVTRSVAYRAELSQIKIINFVMANVTDIALKRAEEQDIIKINVGYRLDGVDRWAPLANGRVAIWKQDGLDLVITFVEGVVDAKMIVDYLVSTYPLVSPLSATWPVILQQIYPKINGLEYVPNTLAYVGVISMFDILTQFTGDTQLLWFFANETLNITPIDPPGPARDISKIQRNNGGTMQETNPYLVLENVNPLKRVTRLWQVESMFIPDLLPGKKVTFYDTAGLSHTGVIATTRVTGCAVTNKAEYSVFETSGGAA